jgi:hypothetical protein
VSKSEVHLGQVGIRKAKTPEPLLKRRDPETCRQNQRLLDPLGSVRRTPGYGADGDRRRGGASLIRALMWNCGNLSLRCQGRSPSGDHHEASVPMRSTGTDQPVRAMKAGHAAGAKGLDQAVVVNVQLATGGDLGGNEAVQAVLSGLAPAPLADEGSVGYRPASHEGSGRTCGAWHAGRKL